MFSVRISPPFAVSQTQGNLAWTIDLKSSRSVHRDCKKMPWKCQARLHSFPFYAFVVSIPRFFKTVRSCGCMVGRFGWLNPGISIKAIFIFYIGTLRQEEENVQNANKNHPRIYSAVESQCSFFFSWTSSSRFQLLCFSRTAWRCWWTLNKENIASK